MSVSEAVKPAPQDQAGASMREDLRSHIGRFAAKSPDWDAFPANSGYPELARAQVRFVGAGGSPKVSDPTTMKAEHFTLSLVHLPAGHYAASHVHEVEEAFYVVQGVLTVASDFDGRIVRTRLGPRDMLLNEPNRPHGFLNDGLEPVLMAIMVANVPGTPVKIRYKYHPKDVDAEVARTFGESLQATAPSADLREADRRAVDRWVTRHSQARVERLSGGLSRMVYIGAGGAPAGHFRKDFLHLPPGGGVRAYRRNVEDVYFVMTGYLTVGWEDGGKVVEERLGPREAVFNPAGRAHYFRNDGIEDVGFLMIVGTPLPEDVKFDA